MCNGFLYFALCIDINLKTLTCMKNCEGKKGQTKVILKYLCTKKYLTDNKPLAFPFDKGIGICLVKTPSDGVHSNFAWNWIKNILSMNGCEPKILKFLIKCCKSCRQNCRLIIFRNLSLPCEIWQKNLYTKNYYLLTWKNLSCSSSLK